MTLVYVRQTNSCSILSQLVRSLVMLSFNHLKHTNGLDALTRSPFFFSPIPPLFFAHASPALLFPYALMLARGALALSLLFACAMQSTGVAFLSVPLAECWSYPTSPPMLCRLLTPPLLTSTTPLSLTEPCFFVELKLDLMKKPYQIVFFMWGERRAEDKGAGSRTIGTWEQLKSPTNIAHNVCISVVDSISYGEKATHRLMRRP